VIVEKTEFEPDVPVAPEQEVDGAGCPAPPPPTVTGYVVAETGSPPGDV
jgi:hypothetical protein